jgi:hypothetical protein
VARTAAFGALQKIVRRAGARCGWTTSWRHDGTSPSRLQEVVMFAVSRSTLVAVSLSLLGSVLLAQDGKTPPVPTPAAKHEKQGEKKETYAVVEVGHHLSTVTEGAVEALRKEKHAAFEAAMADYHKAKAAAEASKQPFAEKAPKEELVVVRKGGLASMADAEKALAELKQAEKAKEAGDKPKDKPAPHGDGGHKPKPKG